MSVAKVIEISAESPDGFEAAAREGIQRAAKTVQNIQTAWVKEQKIVVEDGKAISFRVDMKITFLLKE